MPPSARPTRSLPPGLSDPGPAAREPLWSVRLQCALREGPEPFSLDMDWQSPARRVVLFGPSGAGKTQTLRGIAGLLRGARGRIVLAGRPLLDSAAGLDLPAAARRLGLVFQDHALFPHLSVRQNIAFGRHAGWRNPPRRGHDPVVECWIETFGLGPVADQPPSRISGGQRQRTALARALAQEPEALLLDEPFSALDAPLRTRLRLELLEVQRTLALPMLLITHDRDDVAVLAEDVIEVDAGRVVVPTA